MSYFIGPDHVRRIVTSQGTTINTWQLILSPSPHLVQEGAVDITTGQDPGFFTVVSSNGVQAGTGIIWAVGRPRGSTSVNLFAFAATASGGTYKPCFPRLLEILANMVVMPTSSSLSRTEIHVAAYQALTIFGVRSGIAAQALQLSPAAVASPSSPHVITGTLPVHYRHASGTRRIDTHPPNANGQGRKNRRFSSR